MCSPLAVMSEGFVRSQFAVLQMTPVQGGRGDWDAGDLGDLLMAHSSWFTYAGMTRIYKHYEFALRHPAMRMQKASFSSYAGMPDAWLLRACSYSGGSPEPET